MPTSKEPKCPRCGASQYNDVHNGIVTPAFGGHPFEPRPQEGGKAYDMEHLIRIFTTAEETGYSASPVGNKPLLALLDDFEKRTKALERYQDIARRYFDTHNDADPADVDDGPPYKCDCLACDEFRDAKGAK